MIFKRKLVGIYCCVNSQYASSRFFVNTLLFLSVPMLAGRPVWQPRHEALFILAIE